MTTDNAKTRNNSEFNEDLRDLWNQYILIQEQLLRKRSAPISIDPETISIDGHKFYVNVDESGRDKIIENIYRERLKLYPDDIEKGSILVQESVWENLTPSEVDSIRRELASCYIEMGATPAINATIFYGNNINLAADQLTLNEIQNMDTALSFGHVCKEQVEDKVACITTLNVDTELYYLYVFGEEHFSRKFKEHEGKQIPRDTIEYKNSFISTEELKKYSSTIGLRLESYRLVFRIDNMHAKDVMRCVCDYYEPKENAFVFKRQFERGEHFSDDTLLEIQSNIKAFLSEARYYCSEDEVHYDVLFRYGTSLHKTCQYILGLAAEYTYNNDGMSLNTEHGNLGIDFNWRTDNIDKIISDFKKANPFVEPRYYGTNHKFKCKITTSFVGFDEIKDKLFDRFQGIIVIDDPDKHCIRISLPCQDVAYYERLHMALKNELAYLNNSYAVKIDRQVPGRVRIPISENEESRIEDIEDTLRDMRKIDFGFEIEDKVIPFGKLLKVDYPKLLFDVDVPQADKEEAIFEFLQQRSIRFVAPILTGDIEKISRLKNTFTMAASGVDLQNDNLQNFIFDSHLATKTDDINLILRRDGVPYKELNEHLLNKRINESQKDAILKCIFAKDMAVIQGPPGSGKSTAIAELIWQLIRHGLKRGNEKERILLSSETNLAVDNAISRIVNKKTNLVKPIRFGEEEKLESEGLQFSIELMKKWVEMGNDALILDENDEETGEALKSDIVLNNWLENISDRSFYGMSDENNEVITRWKNVLASPNQEVRELVYKNYVSSCNVIGATCSSIGDTKSTGKGATPFFRTYREVFGQKCRKIEFTTVIQDESSKATPAELVLPFVYGKRAIVIGDHRQLPPMLDKEEMENSLEYALAISKKEEDREKIIKLQKFIDTQYEKIEESHFQRLYENIDSSLKETFNLQYRMHPDINDVIKQFYLKDGGLNCGLVIPRDLGVNDTDFANPASRYHGLDIRPFVNHKTHVLFINTDSPEMLDGTSRVNYGEIETIGKLLDRFEASSTFERYSSKFDKDEDKQIGIISFYGKQIKQIRALAYQHRNIPIRVSTVDRFQGMERNIIIVSMVRSHIIQSHKDEEPNFKRYSKYGYPEQHSLGFAQSPNRLNVALSRARRLLVIVGNEQLFSQHPIYKSLFETIRRNPNNVVINQSEL